METNLDYKETNLDTGARMEEENIINVWVFYIYVYTYIYILFINIIRILMKINFKGLLLIEEVFGHIWKIRSLNICHS